MSRAVVVKVIVEHMHIAVRHHQHPGPRRHAGDDIALRREIGRAVVADDIVEDADIVPALLRQVLQARAAGAGQITVQSSPHFTRDYVHLDDVVDALIRIAVHGQAPVYNVASGVNVSNAELFDYLKLHWGCAVQPLLDTRPAPTPRVSTERLRTELQWQPRMLLAALDQAFQAPQRKQRLAMV